VPLNDVWIIEEIRREIKKILDTHENENTSHSSLWDTVKVVLREKYIVMNICIKIIRELKYINY
jgi:hypothetical protein